MNRFSEDELVAAIRRLLSGDAPGVRLGIGDDAALVEIGPHVEILTTDLLVEDVHFRRATISARDLGAKALTVNVSDVAAMGGSPRFALVSLAIPADVELPWVVELYGGLRDAAAEYGMSIVGGDSSRADRVIISVALTGEVAPTGAVLRSGARPGDRVIVTGSLGGAAGGLWLAAALAPGERREAAAAVVTSWGRELLEAHMRPVARVGEGQTLAQSGATAMIDLSDGLAADLGRLCSESGVAAAIRLADIPVTRALGGLRDAFGLDPLELALSGGEDYELLATLPAVAIATASSKMQGRFGTALTEIGEIREGEGLMAVELDGAERPLEAKGWDHFGG